MISEEAALIFNSVGVVQLSQEADFFQDILPLLQTLLAKVGHLFDGNNLLSDQTTCIVHCSKTSMPNLTQIFKSLLRIIFVKKLSYFWVLQATRPVNKEGSMNFCKININDASWDNLVYAMGWLSKVWFPSRGKQTKSLPVKIQTS